VAGKVVGRKVVLAVPVHLWAEWPARPSGSTPGGFHIREGPDPTSPPLLLMPGREQPTRSAFVLRPVAFFIGRSLYWMLSYTLQAQAPLFSYAQASLSHVLFWRGSKICSGTDPWKGVK